jgi:site-specific DNA-methyltransferase (adenine-specific)
MTHQLHHGDCLEVLRSMPDCSVDSIVTDPPYGLSFMGKKWDYDVPSVDVWVECLRVLKPGGHLLAFAGTRTQHRMAVRIEDAGFEIRDMIAWVYGSGFPKSLDVSKAIDKAAGAEREVVGSRRQRANNIDNSRAPVNASAGEVELITAPSTDAARQWQGWGTALKPALEPITVARKPLVGTVAENVLQHGTGAINVDGGRVGTGDDRTSGGATGKRIDADGGYSGGWGFAQDGVKRASGGRWPANFIHDGGEEVVALFPDTKSGGGDKHGRKASTFCASTDWEAYKGTSNGGDSGSAARFFYCAKASKADRGENHHPTVKPTDLMRYLCRLVTPPNGIVLDPFNGSGSTGCAAVLEGFQYIGIEREAEYIAISEKRIQARSKQVQEQPKQLTLL